MGRKTTVFTDMSPPFEIMFIIPSYAAFSSGSREGSTEIFIFISFPSNFAGLKESHFWGDFISPFRRPPPVL